MRHEIQLIDALEGLKSLPDKSVDLIITDPAYEALEKHRAVGTTTRLKNWFDTVPNDFFPGFFRECHRVLKSGTDLYVMCNDDFQEIVKPAMREANFEKRLSIIWHKVGKEVDVLCPHCGGVAGQEHSAGTPGMSYPFRSSWEMIAHGRKGKRPAPENKSIRNVFSAPWLKGKSFYPTEKPPEIFLPLLEQSSEPGQLVVDPFAGSGSVGEACFQMGRDFLGFDISQGSLDFFENRKKHRVTPDRVTPDGVTPDGVEPTTEPANCGVVSFFGKKNA